MATKTSKRGKRTGKKLTARALKAAKHSGRESGGKPRQEVHWDTEVPGLGLRVYPSGRRSWVLRYKVRGRRRIVVLGAYGVLSLHQARSKARAKLVELDQTEVDPLARPERMPTLRELIPPFLEDRSTRVKPSTLATYRVKARHIEEDLGSHAVDEITDRHVQGAFDRWTRELGPVAANQAARLLRAVLDYAGRRNLRDRTAPNPVDSVERNREPRRGRELTPAELKRIRCELVREEQDRPEAADTVAAILLLALTGARRREITELTWPEVDLQGRLLRLADSKTGAREVPLNTPAQEILAELPRVDGELRVFPPTRHEVSYAVQYTWKRVRERAGCPGARLHDFRHTFVTRGLSANLSETLVGKVVGHRSAATTRRYEHVTTDPVREATEQIGSSIAADLEGRPSAEVVRFERGRTA